MTGTSNVVVNFCQIRDEEVLLMQEERRKANAMTTTDTRMRGSTVSAS
jgi:hypothetical protein